MQQEQTVHRKKLIQSDRLLFFLVITLLVAASLLLGYLEYALEVFTPPLQIFFFLVLIVLCYFIITRQMTAFHYVLTENTFAVFRLVGKSEKLVERVFLHEIVFVAPYASAKGEKGREFALCVTKKQEAIVIAHRVNDRRQWLIVNIDAQMQAAIKRAQQTSASVKYA